jgi:hypothetical protein
MILNHIQFLEKKIYNIYSKSPKHIIYTTYKYKTDKNIVYKDIPYIFEYYSAIHMTKLFNKPFFVYKDFSKQLKINQNFPVQDHGIDLIDESLNNIGQVKYYSSKNCITYGKLSTFLASEKLTRKPLSFYLVRTDHCLLDNNIKSMINNNIIHDIPINIDLFNQEIKIINNKYSK